MPNSSRPSETHRESTRRATAIALTLGEDVRRSRRRIRMSQARLAYEIGVSQSSISRIERGLGQRVPLERWVAIGVVIGLPIAVSFSRPASTDREPADAGHLVIQEHLLALAKATERHDTFEVPTRPLDPTRSADVGIRDAAHRVRILAECWNSFGDFGAAVRVTNRKAAEAAATWPDDRIAIAWVVRASAANRALVARYPHILAAAFPGSSRQWVRALTDAGAVPPALPGFVWFDPATRRLTEWRRATIAP